MSERPLWSPDEVRAAASNLRRFMERVERTQDLVLESYDDVLRYSVEQPGPSGRRCGTSATSRPNSAALLS